MNTVDIDNMIPLHYSVKLGHKAIAELLLSRGVPIDSGVHPKTWHSKIVEYGTIYEEFALSSTLKVPQPIAVGLTPLHFATLTGNPVMTAFLLDHSADPNALSDYGKSPLHLTLRTKLYGTKYQDNWVDPYLRTERLWDFIHFDKDDVDAIIADITQRQIAVLDALLADPKTSLTIRDCENECPIDCIQYKQPETTTVIQKLLSKGADLFCGNLKQQTALHFTCRAGNHNSVSVLLSRGADMALTDDEVLMHSTTLLRVGITRQRPLS